MYLVIAFISETRKINELINRMRERGFTGGTLLDGVGMKHVMPKALDVPLIASLHSLFSEEGEINKVLMCVVQNEDDARDLMDLIEEVIGDLHQPQTGLVISLKIEHMRGYDHWSSTEI